MDFDWDPKKDLLNQKKHAGLSFEVAKLVFSDPSYILEQDRVDEFGEERWHATGLVGDAPLLVVHVYRETKDGKKIIRIISARKANHREFCRYFYQPSD